MSIKSKIQALITAANATTGESDATLTDAVQTLVDGYGQGGGVTTQPLSVTENGTYTAPSGTAYTPVTVNVPTGGSLPSVISKIDGGSFTLASDTKCSGYSIATTLNVPAKYFLIWTDDLNSFGAISNKGLILATVNIRQFESASGTTRYGFYSYIQRQAAGGSYQGALTMNYANQPETFTNNNMINYYVGDTYYIAGKLYKWVAFA